MEEKDDEMPESMKAALIYLYVQSKGNREEFELQCSDFVDKMGMPFEVKKTWMKFSMDVFDEAMKQILLDCLLTEHRK